MKIYLPRYLSKILLFAIIAIILLFVVLSFVINYFLSSSKARIEETLSRYCNQRVTIESVYYFPPNFIILDNIVILTSQLSENKQFLSVEKAEISFSFKKLITKRIFALTNIYLNKPASEIIDYTYISKEGVDKIIGFINSLGKNRALGFVIKEGSLALPGQVETDSHIVIDSVLNIKPGGIISSRGSIALRNLSLKEESTESILNYKFYGHLERNGVVVDNLELLRENFYLRVWGALENNILRLSGNLFSSHLVGAFYLRKTAFDFIDQFKEILKFRKRKFTQLVSPVATSLNIFDLGCLIKFVHSGFHIENLSFSLEDMPLRLKGSIIFSDTPKINMQFGSFSYQAEPARSENPKRFDLEVVGFLQEGKFNGKMELNFLRASEAKRSSQKVETGFKNLGFYFTDDERLNMFFEKADITYTADNNSYSIFLEDFVALSNLKDKETKSIKFNSLIYDGVLEGGGLIDISRIPFKSSFKLDITDVNANKLSSLLIYLSKVYGKFSAQINYTNYPDFNLKGKILINNGYLDNLRFFSWLSDFFTMPELKKVDFRELSANFLVNNEVSSLENIVLDSEEITLSGYFNLYANDLVSGKLSLILSQTLLDTSPKFNKLLRLLGKDLSSVSFDFQTSGLYETMNFKWLESDFKMRLQKLLPAGMERKLENEIEDAVEAISTEK